MGDDTDVESREHGRRQLDEPDPEPVLPAGCDALHEARLDQRSELPRNGACGCAGPARDLVRPERRLRGEHVEDGQGALRRPDAFT